MLEAASRLTIEVVKLLAQQSVAGAPPGAPRPSSDTTTEVMHSLYSVGEEDVESCEYFGDLEEEGSLTLDSIHKFIASSRHLDSEGVPKRQVITRISGTGLAPWEIHRPQQFVRDLVRRGCFAGCRVLDAGCGIGDNALFVAKACPGASVVAVDVVPRCLEFAAAKAKLRGMTGEVVLEAADLMDPDLHRLPPSLGPAASSTFDAVLDSSTFHCFGDEQRGPYVAALARLLRPCGRVFMNCMSEEDTRVGGPRRVTVSELHSLFNAATGWEVESVEDSIIELHPTFWGGKAKARLITIRKLWA